MDDLGLVGDLAIVVVAALVGGILARLLRLPAVIGYLAAGFVIGPHTPGPSGDIDDVQIIADLGVALLMFTLGIRFSLPELNEHRKFAFASGVVGTGAVLAVAFAVSLVLGVDEKPALVIGMAVSISSTMLAMRMLDDQGLITGEPGRLAVVTSLVQDMTVVVMLVAIPLLAGNEDNLLLELALAFAEAAALLIGIWVAGTFVLPRILERVAASRSRELFLLAVLAVALGTASLSSVAGLSVAFGAFVGGLLISSSPYAQRTLNEVLPLRDVFAVVFFVAIGMLIDPDSFADRPDLVFGLAAVGIFAKMVLISAPGLLLGYSARAVVPGAIALANMGEFSFVLVTQAVDEDILSQTLRDMILASVLVTMAVSPIIFLAQERFVTLVERFTGAVPTRADDVPVSY
jgi:CPA2 family monovalent cation:H+ antiporter-2